MKPTQRRWLAAFFSAAIFLLSLTACTPQVSPSGSDGQVPSGMSDGTSSKSSEIRVSFGYDIQFPGSMIGKMEGVDTIVKEFDYAGGELKVNLYFKNGVEGTTELGLLIFCEGVPVEYTLLDSGETGAFHVLQIEGEKTVKVSLKPDFDLDLGRIDFHVVPLPNEKESLMLNDTMAVHAVLPEGYQAEGTYSDVIGDVENARIIAMPEVLKQTKASGTNLLVMDLTATEIIGSGATTYEIEGKEETRIGVYVPAPGTYRLVFFLDGEPFALEDGKTVLNCEFGQDEMYSVTVPMKQMLSAGEHSLFAIATRIDEQSFQTRESCRSLSSFRVKIIN